MNDVNNIGIYRSTDTGATFTRLSGSGGLPLGRTYDLAADPANNAVFYTGVRASPAPPTASTRAPTPAPPGRA